MILTQLKDYIRLNRQVSLRQMSKEFDMEQDALRPVLEHWIAKGKVEKLPQGSSCDGCHSCEPQAIEIYQWIG